MKENMGLSTEKYNEIMRDYERKRIEARGALDRRTAEVFNKYPKIKEISEEISSYSFQSAKRLILDSEGSISDIREGLSELIKTKERFLLEAGYDKGYLSLHYECNDCKDTGFIDGEKCHCLKEKIIDALYSQSNIKDRLEHENFSTFNIEYYTDKFVDSVTGKNSRQNILEAYALAKDYINGFDTSFKNLFIYGETGVGKTFLTNCIAKELIDTAHSVIYLSSIKLFEMLANDKFNRNTDFDTTIQPDNLLDCDLLVIDDLGTEMINSFTTSALFNLINERFLRNKSVIISSNLSIGQLRDIYSERIFSRIASNYILLKIFGRDLRLETLKSDK